MKITTLTIIATLSVFTQTAQALSLPEGCFRGTISNGAEIIIEVTKLPKSKYNIIEQSDLNFGPEPYSNFDFIDEYVASLAKEKMWFNGKQSEVRISFSVFGASRVVLTPLTRNKIRYHRTVKLYVSDPHEFDEVVKVKGTLTKDSGACVNLQ